MTMRTKTTTDDDQWEWDKPGTSEQRITTGICRVKSSEHPLRGDYHKCVLHRQKGVEGKEEYEQDLRHAEKLKDYFLKCEFFFFSFRV